MTPEQGTALLGAVTAVLVAVTGLIIQVRALRHDIDGHVASLVGSMTEAAHKQGELEGRDFMRAVLTSPETVKGSNPDAVS